MKPVSPHTLVLDYLTALGVPHTAGYTERQYEAMPFKSMFGVTKLLESYGVKSQGYNLAADKADFASLTPPFLAQTAGGWVIVTGNDSSSVDYISEGEPEKVSLADFNAAWNGNVVLSFPQPDAAEPHYAEHARIDWLNGAKKWVLAFCAVALLAWGYVAQGFYTSIGASIVVLFDLCGLYFAYMLVQKTLGYHTAAADRVCGVLQQGGCDHVLASDASKFFGLFSWSEVGFSYFSVSLAAALVFGFKVMPALALINICCLPYTVWSIWYQRFREHHWCTLCVSVQTTLWLLFFSYLIGGFTAQAWPPMWLGILPLGFAYVAVLLGLNALEPVLKNKKQQ